MKKIVGYIFLTALLISCSSSDSNTFSLICNVDSKMIQTVNKVGTEIVKNESITLNFKNKKLDSYDCPIWDEERISCGRDINNALLYLQDRLVLDRKSGVVNYFKVSKEGHVTENKSYSGKCEKAKGNKF